MGSLLPETTLQRRKKKNVLDLTDHSVGFAVEIMITILLLVTHALPEKWKVVSILTFMAFYGLLGFAHIVTSSTLKAELWLLIFNFSFIARAFLQVARSFRKCLDYLKTFTRQVRRPNMTENGTNNSYGINALVLQPPRNLWIEETS